MPRPVAGARCAALLVIVLSACGGGGGSSTLFSDSFDGYATGTWPAGTAQGGWQSLLAHQWTIATGGVTGNALYFTSNSDDYLLQEIAPQDYTVSVSIRHDAISPYAGGSYAAGLVARLTDGYSHYRCFLYDDDSIDKAHLVLVKRWTDGVLSASHAIASDTLDGPLDTSRWYRLSMSFQGGEITARASSAVDPELTITATDDGVADGPVLSGGHVGVFSDAEVSFHPYFDDFLVTAP